MLQPCGTCIVSGSLDMRPQLAAQVRRLIRRLRARPSQQDLAIKQMPYHMEGAQGTPATEDQGRAAEGVPRLSQKGQLVLNTEPWALVHGDGLQVLLHLLNVGPDGLGHHWEVLVQLTACHTPD